MKMRYVPNVLSLFRILFSGSLLLAHRHSALFIACYFTLGASDLLDGRLARRYHWQSEFGVKLDGLGDALFFLCAFVSMFFPPRLEFNVAKILITSSVPIAFKLFVLILTRVRFGIWNGMHTYSNKFFDSLLFFSVPVFIWMGEIDLRILLVLAVIATTTAVEETVILFTADTYDPNHKGIFVEKLLTKRGHTAQ